MMKHMLSYQRPGFDTQLSMVPQVLSSMTHNPQHSKILSHIYSTLTKIQSLATSSVELFLYN